MKKLTIIAITLIVCQMSFSGEIRSMTSHKFTKGKWRTEEQVKQLQIKAQREADIAKRVARNAKYKATREKSKEDKAFKDAIRNRRRYLQQKLELAKKEVDYAERQLLDFEQKALGNSVSRSSSRTSGSYGSQHSTRSSNFK